jgi:hypothetical protein
MKTRACSTPRCLVLVVATMTWNRVMTVHYRRSRSYLRQPEQAVENLYENLYE